MPLNTVELAGDLRTKEWLPEDTVSDSTRDSYQGITGGRFVNSGRLGEGHLYPSFLSARPAVWGNGSVGFCGLGRAIFD